MCTAANRGVRFERLREIADPHEIDLRGLLPGVAALSVIVGRAAAGVAQASELGAKFLQKPFSPALLGRTIREILDAAPVGMP